jgi:hypothetical protein
MGKRVNHPLKSLFQFALVAALAYGAWYVVVERKMLQGHPEQMLTSEERDRIRDMILERFKDDRCFLELGEIVLRPKENLYRIELRVGYACEERARQICQEISDLVEDRFGRPTSAWARDDAGNEVAHHVP